MSFWKSPKYNLTESEIRYAMRNTKTNTEAARFLHICPSTYHKYAKKYVDAETGLTLDKLQRMKGRYRAGGRTFIKVEEILEDGKSKYISSKKLKLKLIESGIMADRCEICGHSEGRLHDNASSTVLVHLNKDDRDHRLENLKIVCYNCYYLYYGGVRVSRYYDESNRYDPRKNDTTDDNEIDFSQY